MRSVKLVALVPAAALALAACSSLGAAPAASVNGTEIAAGRVEEELALLRGNEEYRRLVERQFGSLLGGTGQGTFNSAFVAQLLSLDVYFALIDAELAELGAAVGGDDLQAARAELTAGGGQSGRPGLSEESLESFPDDYERTILRRSASFAKLSDVLARDYYDDHVDEFTQVCVRHILASTDQRSDAEARARIEDLGRRLEAGADFGELAAAESDDPVASVAGGSVGCGGKDRLVPDFAEAVFRLRAGQVSGVVKTSLGYHLIEVTDRRTATFQQVRAQAGRAAVDDFLRRAGVEGDIEVNPRFGEWSVPGEGEGRPRVKPPAGPVPTSVPEGGRPEGGPPEGPGP